MEDEKKTGDKPSLAEKWLKRIIKEGKAHDEYRKRALAAQEAYDDDKTSSTYPIFWSTIELLRGAIYARTPLPDVRKRNNGKTPSADKIAMAVEQSIAYFVDVNSIGSSFESTVLDFLVRGLGVCRARLETETAMVPVMFVNPLTMQPEPVIDEATQQPAMQEQIVSQSVKVEPWPANQFRWEPAQCWDKVKWVCFDHFMTYSEIEKEFDVEISEGGVLNDGVTSDSSEKNRDKYAKTYVVHEIWDSNSGNTVWVSPCYKEKPLRVEQMPLDLVGKFPTPKPMFDGVKSDDLVPDPYFRRIARRVIRLNKLTGRINALIDSIKDVGAYDASFSELAQISDANDGTRIPVANLLDRINQNGSGRASFDSVVALIDNRPVAEVLRRLIEIRQIEEDLFFKDTGISDIVRGASNASETATAQSIKDNWANVRIGPKIKQVATYIRDMYRIIAEIISNNFESDQIRKTSGIQDLSDEEIQVLRDDFARSYIIDVETDATVAQNENVEKQQRLEALKTFTDYLNGMLPAVQNNSLPADLMKEMLLFVLGSFKAGRQLEDVVNSLPDSMQQLQKMNQNNQQLQQQLQQANEQMQGMQKQLGDLNAHEAQINAGKASAEIGLKNAQTAKITEEAKQLAMSNVIPMGFA